MRAKAFSEIELLQKHGIMEDEEFPLMVEYNEMRALSESLYARIDCKEESDDWFENF